MKKALVVLSGGQDSATCLAWAKVMFDKVVAVSFDYDQRHQKELQSAKKMCEAMNVDHMIKEVPTLMGGYTSGLTNSDVSVNDIDKETGLPTSFVPGRNLVFLNLAASLGLSHGIFDLVTGVCQTDYSGYPDCRHETISCLTHSIYLGNKELIDAKNGSFHIHTPLMFLTKAESVLLAKRLPRGLEMVGMSWTCYEGGEKPCGVCGACKLRIKGFNEARIDDPAIIE